jgi:flavin reductase (DIM6/NTAB) family NADH-FMN oxidoreductase RutF
MTVSTLTSVSLDPPLLLVCIARHSRTLAAIRAQGAFAVHLLRDDQTSHSAAFARSGSSDPFVGISWSERAGVPVLGDCLAWAACALERAFEAGDHEIVVGRVSVSECLSGAPLLWHDSGYRHLAAATPTP